MPASRKVADAMDLMQLGEELLGPLSGYTIGGTPLGPRDWAAIALAAMDQAGADRYATSSLRIWVRQILGIE